MIQAGRGHERGEAGEDGDARAGGQGHGGVFTEGQGRILAELRPQRAMHGRHRRPAYHHAMASEDGFDHDILILGGGLVGSSLACALDGRGWRVAQVEASLPAGRRPGLRRAQARAGPGQPERAGGAGRAAAPGHRAGADQAHPREPRRRLRGRAAGRRRPRPRRVRRRGAGARAGPGAGVAPGLVGRPGAASAGAGAGGRTAGRWPGGGAGAGRRNPPPAHAPAGGGRRHPVARARRLRHRHR